MMMPLIIGHRGNSASFPENTIAAIESAFEEGADGVEVDVRSTGDDKLVCIHDADTSRVSGGLDCMCIQKCTYKELTRVNVGAKFPGPTKSVPLFSSVVEAIPHGKNLFIHLKDSHRVIQDARKACSILNKSDFNPANVLLVCNSLSDAVQVKEDLPSAKVSAIVFYNPCAEYEIDPGGTKWLSLIAEYAAIDAIHLCAPASIDSGSVGEICNNSAVHVHTINSIFKAAEWTSATSITTNAPGMIRHKLEQYFGYRP